MADAFSFRIITAPTRNALHAIDRHTDRATMYTVRQAGRVVKQVAKRTVRVYSGERSDIPRGRLKKAIHSDKRLGGGHGTYSVKVGPRGWPVKGYAHQIEDLDHYMQAGYEAAVQQAPEIARKAWERSTRHTR